MTLRRQNWSCNGLWAKCIMTCPRKGTFLLVPAVVVNSWNSFGTTSKQREKQVEVQFLPGKCKRSPPVLSECVEFWSLETATHNKGITSKNMATCWFHFLAMLSCWQSTGAANKKRKYGASADQGNERQIEEASSSDILWPMTTEDEAQSPLLTVFLFGIWRFQKAISSKINVWIRLWCPEYGTQLNRETGERLSCCCWMEGISGWRQSRWFVLGVWHLPD